MLRLVIALAVWVLSGPARAEGAPGLDVSALLRDGGPWGALTVAAVIIWYLWSRLGTKDDEIRDLNKDLITATGRAEKVAGDNTAALQAFDARAAVRSEKDADKWAAIKQLGEDATRTTAVVTGNAEAMRRSEVALEAIRVAIVDLTKAFSELARELARAGR